MIDLIKNPAWIEAVAKLAGAILWPIVAFFLAMLFKGEISSIIRRIKKGKFFGNEFELEDELNELAEATERAQKEIYIPAAVVEDEEKGFGRGEAPKQDYEQIMARASENPELGLIFIARKIELEMKRLLAVSGHLRGRRSLSYRDMAEYLGRNAAVSENLRKSLDLFWDVRNKIVHSHGEVSREDLIRTIDIGLTVLSAISVIPHEKNVVAHPGADLFADPEGRQPIQSAKALILETTSPGGAAKSIRVFPTTRTDYRKGMAVTWEWNMEKTWGPSYYRDPTTGRIIKAWSVSAEFVGRDLDAI